MLFIFIFFNSVCLIPYKFRSPSLIQIFARFLMLLFTKGRIPVLGLFYATSKCVFPNWRLQCYIHKYTFGLIVLFFLFHDLYVYFLKSAKNVKSACPYFEPLTLNDHNIYNFGRRLLIKECSKSQWNFSGSKQII